MELDLEEELNNTIINNSDIDGLNMIESPMANTDLSLDLTVSASSSKDIPTTNMTTSTDSAFYSVAGSRSASASPLPQAMSQSMRYENHHLHHPSPLVLTSSLQSSSNPSFLEQAEELSDDADDWSHHLDSYWSSHTNLHESSTSTCTQVPTSNNSFRSAHALSNNDSNGNTSALKRKCEERNIGGANFNKSSSTPPMPSKCPHLSAECTPCHHCIKALQSMNQLTAVNQSLIAQTHDHYKNLKALLKQSEMLGQQIQPPNEFLSNQIPQNLVQQPLRFPAQNIRPNIETASYHGQPLNDKRLMRLSMVSTDSGYNNYDSSMENSFTDRLDDLMQQSTSNASENS